MAPSLVPAEDPSKRELLRFRPQGGLASALTTSILSRGGYHWRLSPFLCFPSQSLGSVLSSTGGATGPTRSQSTSLHPNIGDGHTGGRTSELYPF